MQIFCKPLKVTKKLLKLEASAKIYQVLLIVCSLQFIHAASQKINYFSTLFTSCSQQKTRSVSVIAHLGNYARFHAKREMRPVSLASLKHWKRGEPASPTLPKG